MVRAAVLWARLAVYGGLAACGDGRDDLFGAADASGPSPDGDAGPVLCVFDYDLTLSSHLCRVTAGDPNMHCRITVCDTYGWHDQCLGVNARDAVAECVRRGAMIGIASHANADNCWDDKVTPILAEMQFPEWTGSPLYAAGGGVPWEYPALDERANWNCHDCAYTMDGSVAKPDSVSRVMRYYGLDPDAPADRGRVIFWDDTPGNIDAVEARMPEVHTILVPRNGNSGQEGGCGITTVEIERGWAEVEGR